MPQIGWSELLVIVILAVLIIGPKDMPIVLKKIASSVKKIKSYISNIQDEDHYFNYANFSKDLTIRHLENLDKIVNLKSFIK